MATAGVSVLCPSAAYYMTSMLIRDVTLVERLKSM